MKSIYILTALIGLQFNSLFASGNPESIVIKTHTEIMDFLRLAPETPKEATFEEVTFEKIPESGLISENVLKRLAPVIPSEAEFNDHL